MTQKYFQKWETIPKVWEREAESINHLADIVD